MLHVVPPWCPPVGSFFDKHVDRTAPSALALRLTGVRGLNDLWGTTPRCDEIPRRALGSGW